MRASTSKTPSYRNRIAVLAAHRNAKMARSAHAYMRGNTIKFYEWLESANGKALPQGPAVWICGDCHVGNLGPVASLKRRVEIQIRDLDQTVIGNPAHDLVRLGLSLATAARSSDLPGVTTARMMEEMMIGYSAGLLGASAAALTTLRSSQCTVLWNKPFGGDGDTSLRSALKMSGLAFRAVINSGKLPSRKLEDSRTF